MVQIKQMEQKDLVYQEHTVSEAVYENILMELKKVNKKIIKAQRSPIEIHNVSNIVEDEEVDGKIYPKLYVNFTISFERPRVKEWEIIASLDFIEGENIFYLISGTEIPPELNKYKLSSSCDHCKHNRKRLYTYILKNTSTGEIVQVGKSCLTKFIDSDTSIMELIATLDISKIVAETKSRENTEGTGQGFPLPKALDIRMFLAGTVLMVNKFGYHKKVYVGNSTGYATGDRTWSFLTSGLYPENYKELGEQADLVNDIIAWLHTLKGSKESYFHNINVLASTGVVREKHSVLASSIYNAYKNIVLLPKEKERQYKEDVKNGVAKWKLKFKPEGYNKEKFLGEVGDIFEGLVKVESKYSFHGEYGYTTCFTMRNEYGEVLVWYTASKIDMQDGKEYRISCKLKKYFTNNKGLYQAYINYVKII